MYAPRPPSGHAQPPIWSGSTHFWVVQTLSVYSPTLTSFGVSVHLVITPQHPTVRPRTGPAARKRGAVNAATAPLGVLLLFGAGPRAVPQEQDNESQPVDQAW